MVLQRHICHRDILEGVPQPQELMANFLRLWSLMISLKPLLLHFYLKFFPKFSKECQKFLCSAFGTENVEFDAFFVSGTIPGRVTCHNISNLPPYYVNISNDRSCVIWRLLFPLSLRPIGSQDRKVAAWRSWIATFPTESNLVNSANNQRFLNYSP